MDSVPLETSKKRVVDKLSRTTKRIQKARKNIKIAEKEAAEFEEIQKLLENIDDPEPASPKPEFLPENLLSDCSVIPVTSPGLKVFHKELVYSLFKESDCLVENFVNSQEKCLIFGKSESLPSEECFRKLIAYHVTENLMPEEGSCSSISLYVLYLMSVHQDPEFVNACFDFLSAQRFHLHPEEIFPIFINFGGKQEDLFEISEESFGKKFSRGENARETSEGIEFPFFNVEMVILVFGSKNKRILQLLKPPLPVTCKRVGRVLKLYITENLLVTNTNTKSLVEGLVKITLDPKIRSGVLLSLYSSILTSLCAKLQKDFKLEEILSWVNLKDEHLLNQLEICRSIWKPLFSELHDNLVLKIISQILNTKNLPARAPIRINHLKSVLKELRRQELPPLELYSLLLLINSSLPGLTATKKDSTEINALLAALERKISKVEDSVDLIRLKLEIAKVGNQVTNNTDNRFTVHKEVKSPVKKVKCSN